VAAPLRFWGVETGTRMTVVRLDDGGLLVHSPVPPEPGLCRAVDGLGPVRAIVEYGFVGELIAIQGLGSYCQEFPPETLSPSDLYQYVQLMQERGENADQFRLVFWQKVTIPLATGAMVLLSLTFVFGPTRGNTAGFRIMVGSLVGIVVHFLNQILGHLGILFSLNLALSTMVPVAGIFCVALWLLSRGP